MCLSRILSKIYDEGFYVKKKFRENMLGRIIVIIKNLVFSSTLLLTHSASIDYGDEVGNLEYDNLIIRKFLLPVNT